MNLVVIHYHLNPGGVTRVIANQLLALDAVVHEPLRVLVLHGPGKDGWPSDVADSLESVQLKLIELPCLSYSTETPAEPARIVDEIQSVLARHDFRPADTVLQFHNHALGKNAHVTSAVRSLAELGYGVLLQIHDFAEDCRAKNHRFLKTALGDDGFSDRMYPSGGRIHYAVLNRRDFRVLNRAGVEESRLHFLPNPILPFASLPDRMESREKLKRCYEVPVDRNFFLYPVRGIRRKNVGELVLWAAILRDQATLAMTLAPMNPAEQERYQAWVTYAADNDLPVVFDTGAELNFEENLVSADWIVTTSVAEGFGMVFLESWLAGRGLTGRDLPDVTADFAESGVQFTHVYDRLPVPVSWIDISLYLEKLRAAIEAIYSDFGLTPPDGAAWDRICDAKTADDLIDFGDLDEPMQRAVIDRVLTDTDSRDRMLRLIDKLGVLNGPASEREVVERRDDILNQYALEPSGQRLIQLLRNVIDSPASTDALGSLDSDAVLDQLLDGASLRLIRS